MIKVTRIAHACVLLDFDGTRILTDPWFSERNGYHPGEGHGIALADLPPLDAVVVSHGHYDHYDMGAFRADPDRAVPMFVRRGIAAGARRAGFTTVTEMDWWDEASVGGVRIVAAPARHGVPENTYVMGAQAGTAYFAADTVLIPELSEVARRFPRVDLLLVPTNGLRIRPLGNRQVVMGAEDGARLCAMFQPRLAVPMHYAFEARSRLHDALLISYDRGPERFVAACRRLAPEVRVRVAAPGEEVCV